MIKNHFGISIVKSILRLCYLLVGLILVLIHYLNAGFIAISLGLMSAEILGILEEIFDKRKEK